MFTTRRISLTAAVAGVLLACAMPAAAAAQQDLRMPDTRDAATAATQNQDLRSADARDAARADEIARQMKRFHTANIAARQDLRSPDTRDIADGRKYPPTATVITIKAPESVPTSRFDWVAAVAGAAIMSGVILLMAAALVVTRHRARRHQPITAS